MIVYRFGCCGGPLDDLDLVMAQMRLAHDYANDHTAIERGRRAALHAVDDTPEAREAAELVRAATKSTRKAAVTALRQARRAARAAAPDELARIAALDEAIRRDARALTQTYWGNYLTVEASAQQQRAMPLYEDDAVTPALPRFRRWVEKGQVSVQLQRGVATSAVRTGQDTRVRLDRGDRKVHTRADALRSTRTSGSESGRAGLPDAIPSGRASARSCTARSRTPRSGSGCVSPAVARVGPTRGRSRSR